MDISQVCRAWDSRRTVSQGGSGKQMPLPLNIPATTISGRELDVVPRPSGSDAARWLEQWKWNSMETVRLSSLPLSGQLSPASPQAVAWECLGNSSVPLSPNRVQERLLQDIPDEGSLFHVSPISPGFCMHPSGAASPHPQTGVLLPTTLDDFSDSVLGDPITYAQCERIPRSDTPMTLPVYTLPSALAYMSGQSSVQTVLALGISSRPEVWSSAIASPMDTEDSPLLTTGLPGCPYRFTLHSGPAFSDVNPASGLQLHHPPFLEFVGAPESRLLYHSPIFLVDQLGEEPAMAAAVNLQRDAGIMLSNLQILSQFVKSLHRMSSEMMYIGMG